MSDINLEEISGFHSPRELLRFEVWVEDQVSSGFGTEIPVESYYSGINFRERWFKFRLNGEVWRLVYPDGPFRGCWRKVSDQDLSG